MKIFNTMSRKTEDFVPLVKGRVSMYTCGPTVYDYAHVGNFRAYVFEDILRRTLKFAGFDVVQVMNLTDVDDKTIKGARREGISLDEYTGKYVNAFFEDLKVLNIEPAEHYPAATKHILEMTGLIETLLKKGYAYKSVDGSVYFSVAKFPAYGRLAHLDMDGLRPGARVVQDEYNKENFGDFALWKAWDQDDGDVAWESPWGRGRPGWHIECSAMSMKYLGPSMDIHTGGVDNMFPHHENEIAQSECATGESFVKYWMHCEHLRVDGQKMSKSLGNFHTLRDLLNRGYTGREIRYVLLSAHYRQMLNFTFSGLDSARASLSRLDEFAGRVKGVAGDASGNTDAPDWAKAGISAFGEAIEDDLNTPQALSALFQMVHDGNRAIDDGLLTPAQAAGTIALLARMDTVLGCLEKAEDEPPDDIMELLDRRAEARKTKSWAESDRIRNILSERGWEVKDTAEGQKIRKKT